MPLYWFDFPDLVTLGLTCGLMGGSLAWGLLTWLEGRVGDRSYRRGFTAGYQQGFGDSSTAYADGYSDAERENQETARRYWDRLVHYFENPGHFHSDRHKNYYDRGIVFPRVPGEVAWERPEPPSQPDHDRFARTGSTGAGGLP